jgi:hypothetical protein
VQHTSNTQHAPGTVVITAASLARYAEFWMSIESLIVPHGTRLIASRGSDIPRQLNEGVRKMTGDWCLILGDDHTFEPDFVMKLLDRKLDFVMPLVARRDFPFVPVILHGPIGEHMIRYSWREFPTSGLFELPLGDGAGQAGALVRKHVLDKLGDPWFEGGKLTPGMLQEDQYFIKRIQELGFKIHIDCELVMGHIANINIVPQRHGGRWYAGHITPQGPVLWDEPELVGWGENIKAVA